MPVVHVADSFLDALAALDGGDAKRAVAFLEKLLRSPDAAGLRPEIVHDAADRSIRSFKVTHDLRAVSHVDGETVLLLFVARHDRAYAWARDRCIECHPLTGERRLVMRGADFEGEPLGATACADHPALCRLLESRGLGTASD